MPAPRSSQHLPLSRRPTARRTARVTLATVLALACLLPAGCAAGRSQSPATPGQGPVTSPRPPRPADACQLLPLAAARAALGDVHAEPARGVEHRAGAPAFDTCSYAALDDERGTARVGVGMLEGTVATLAARKQAIAAQPWEKAKPRTVKGIGSAAFVAGRSGVALVGNREVFVMLGGFTGDRPTPRALEAFLRAVVGRLPAVTPVAVRQDFAPCNRVSPEVVEAVLGEPPLTTRTIATGTAGNGSAVTCLWGTSRRTIHAQVTRDPTSPSGTASGQPAKASVEEVGRLGLARSVAGIGRLAYRETAREAWTVLVNDRSMLEVTVYPGPRLTLTQMRPLVAQIVGAVA